MKWRKCENLVFNVRGVPLLLVGRIIVYSSVEFTQSTSAIIRKKCPLCAEMPYFSNSTLRAKVPYACIKVSFSQVNLEKKVVE